MLSHLVSLVVNKAHLPDAWWSETLQPLSRREAEALCGKEILSSQTYWSPGELKDPESP